jgi:hypothetical protein
MSAAKNLVGSAKKDKPHEFLWHVARTAFSVCWSFLKNFYVVLIIVGIFCAILLELLRWLSNRHHRALFAAAGAAPVGAGPLGALVIPNQIMPPLAVAPVAAGAAPVAHNPANYEPVGHNLQVAAAAIPNPGPQADDVLIINSQLLYELRPMTFMETHNVVLVKRMVAAAQRWKRKTRITPQHFDLVLPGTITIALRGEEHYRIASWALTYDPTNARAKDAVADGYWAYPIVTWAMVRTDDATPYDWLMGQFAPQARYEL